jgi:hypothetical protein
VGMKTAYLVELLEAYIYYTDWSTRLG